jgi:hypothetical protein
MRSEKVESIMGSINKKSFSKPFQYDTSIPETPQSNSNNMGDLEEELFKMGL